MRTLGIAFLPCGTVLAVLGFAVLPAGLLLGWAVVALVVGGCAWHIARDVARDTAARSGRPAAAVATHRSPKRIAGVAAVLTYLTVLVLAGVDTVLGATAASTVAVLGLALAAAAMWVGRGHHHHSPPAPDPGPPTSARDGEHQPPAAGVAPEAYRALSTPHLCLAWRSSYLRLHRATTCPATAEVVLARQRLLDELERRDHTGFQRWLSTGARAASDPSRYISHHT